MKKKQIKKTTKKVVDNMEKTVNKKEEKRKNIIEIGKKIIIPVKKIKESENENEILCEVNYDKKYANYNTHVWFNKKHFMHYKDIYYIEGEVKKVYEKDVELEFTDTKSTFTLLFRKNMIESEI